MSTVPAYLPRLRPMHLSDLDQVARVEQEVYEFPWTRGNFGDSLSSGYNCWVYELHGDIIAYGVLLVAAGEAHLLNLSVARDWQRRGVGRSLLGHFIRVARQCGAREMLLEVRPSNESARRLYAAAGFAQLGVRPHYYPAVGGREPAIVMSLPL